MAQFIVDLMRSWLTPQAPFFDLPPFSICTMALLRNAPDIGVFGNPSSQWMTLINAF